LKIAILGYIDYPSWKQALINGARRLGHTVVTCGPYDNNEMSFYRTNNFRLDIPLEHRYDWKWEEIIHVLENANIEIGNFDMILVFETNVNIEGKKPQIIRDIPVIYIVTDSHRGCDLHISNFNRMNADYIAYSKPYFKRIYEDWIGTEKAFFLPECTDPEIFKPMPGGEAYDVVWAGHKGMKPDGSVEDPIFGENAWRAMYIGYLDNASKTHEFSFRDYDSIRNRELYVEALNSGKIVFNCGGGISPLQAQTSNRIFEGMACGKLVLTSYFVDLPLMFKEGEELVSFKSYHHWRHHYTGMFDCSEIKNIIKHYIKHDEERKEIGENARRCILKKFSGECNIKKIILFLSQGKI